MPVTSQSMHPSPHVVSKRSVETGAIVILWVLAILLWLASTFGNFVQFVGGWGAVWPPGEQTSKGIVYALIYQAIFTVAQWGFKAKRWWMLYTVALLASAVPSFLTYNAWANSWLVARVGQTAPADIAALLASVFLFVIAVVVDLIPEWVLVE
jgi:hypothetical protein